MRVSWALLLSLALLAIPNQTVMGQQASPPDAGAVQTWGLRLGKPLSLVGCVGVDGGTNRFRSPAGHLNPIYRIAVKGFNGYFVKGIRFIGRLVPTPNIAAQAGSIDPQIATMVPGGGYELSTVPVRTRQARLTFGGPVMGFCPSP